MSRGRIVVGSGRDSTVVDCMSDSTSGQNGDEGMRCEGVGRSEVSGPSVAWDWVRAMVTGTAG